MSWNNDDMQDLIANAQRAEMLRQQDRQLEELKKQNSRQPIPRSEPQEKMYKCPACAEWIKAEAKICKHCRTDVSAAFAKKTAAEEKAALDQKKRFEKEKAEEQARKLKEEEAELQRREQQRMLELEELQAKQRARSEQLSKLKKQAKSKKGMTLIAAIASVVAVLITSTIVAGIRQAEQQSALEAEARENALIKAQEKQRELDIESIHLPAVCTNFSNALNVITDTIFNQPKLQLANKGLKTSLKKWEVGQGSGTNFDNFTGFSKAIEKPTKDKARNTRQWLAGVGTSALIDSCNLEKKFTYPSPVTYRGGCWAETDNPTQVELQVKNRGGTWSKVLSQTPGWQPHCFDLGIERDYGYEFVVDRGLLRTSQDTYGTYRAKLSNVDGSLLWDGFSVKYTCESMSTQAVDELYSNGYCIEQ
jgi:type II secretory pathway pseudopilin PulG